MVWPVIPSPLGTGPLVDLPTQKNPRHLRKAPLDGAFSRPLHGLARSYSSVVVRSLNHFNRLNFSLFFYSGGYNSPNAARAWAYLTSIAVSVAPFLCFMGLIVKIDW
jgi:hypothetical protein